jgi:hypothetical protein
MPGKKKGKKKKGKKKKKAYLPPIYEIPTYEDPDEITPKVTIKLMLANPNVPELSKQIFFLFFLFFSPLRRIY